MLFAQLLLYNVRLLALLPTDSTGFDLNIDSKNGRAVLQEGCERQRVHRETVSLSPDPRLLSLSVTDWGADGRQEGVPASARFTKDRVVRVPPLVADLESTSRSRIAIVLLEVTETRPVSSRVRQDPVGVDSVDRVVALDDEPDPASIFAALTPAFERTTGQATLLARFDSLLHFEQLFREVESRLDRTRQRENERRERSCLPQHRGGGGYRRMER